MNSLGWRFLRGKKKKSHLELFSFAFWLLSLLVTLGFSLLPSELESDFLFSMESVISTKG